MRTSSHSWFSMNADPGGRGAYFGDMHFPCGMPAPLVNEYYVCPQTFSQEVKILCTIQCTAHVLVVNAGKPGSPGFPTPTRRRKISTCFRFVPSVISLSLPLAFHAVSPWVINGLRKPEYPTSFRSRRRASTQPEKSSFPPVIFPRGLPRVPVAATNEHLSGAFPRGPSRAAGWAFTVPKSSTPVQTARDK